MLHLPAFGLLALALTIEALVGYPQPLYRAIGHPVTWVGAMIGALDARLNLERDAPATRRAKGAVALALLLGVAGGVAAALGLIVPSGIAGLLVLAVFASTLLAQRSLHDHVLAVADALDAGLPQGRAAVAQIVGRDTATLDEAGVARAAIESLAENFSDGVVAPSLWLALGGLVGGALYKAANTADSMIGHRSARHEAFGYAAARFDDLVNLPASRLSALWLALAACVSPGASAQGAVTAVRRDAARHRSPNAGWPEAAMAGALGFSLAGPRAYGGVMTDDAPMGNGRRELGAAHVRAALRLFRVACGVQWVAVAGLASWLL